MVRQRAWRAACPTCGGDVVEVDDATPELLRGDKSVPPPTRYDCVMDDGQQAKRHVPSDWTPPTEA